MNKNKNMMWEEQKKRSTYCIENISQLRPVFPDATTEALFIFLCMAHSSNSIKATYLQVPERTGRKTWSNSYKINVAFVFTVYLPLCLFLCSVANRICQSTLLLLFHIYLFISYMFINMLRNDEIKPTTLWTSKEEKK